MIVDMGPEGHQGRHDRGEGRPEDVVNGGLLRGRYLKDYLEARLGLARGMPGPRCGAVWATACCCALPRRRCSILTTMSRRILALILLLLGVCAPGAQEQQATQGQGADQGPPAGQGSAGGAQSRIQGQAFSTHCLGVDRSTLARGYRV
jgi:hypothetical protein